MSKVWFITGAGSGIGNAISKEVLNAGDCVVATTRQKDEFQIPEEYKENTLCLQLDTSEQDSSVYDVAVQAAVERFGRIDVLVNNAGSSQCSTRVSITLTLQYLHCHSL